jgi:hypothetical protein
MGEWICSPVGVVSSVPVWYPRKCYQAIERSGTLSRHRWSWCWTGWLVTSYMDHSSLRVACHHLLLVTDCLELELNLWQTVSWPVCLGVGPPFGAHRHLLASSCNVPSLTRGQVCILQCTSLTGHSRKGPVSMYYCLIWGSPSLEGQVPIFISPGTGWSSYALGSLFVASYNTQGYGGGMHQLF